MSGTAATPSGRPKVGEPLLSRAFRILEAFHTPGESLTLSALASRAGLPKSSTLRIATQLVDLGLLERRRDGRFVVGLRMLEIATMAPRGHGLRNTALPYMQDLHRVTNQHVQLAVREGTQAVLVERLSAHNAIHLAHRVGGRMPLDQTGVGIALLTYAPEAIINDVLQSTSDRPTTPAHLVRIRQLVSVVKREGVLALTAADPFDAARSEVTTIASPILDSRGQELGAISIVQPGGRSGTQTLRVALRTASLAIARAVATNATPAG